MPTAPEVVEGEMTEIDDLRERIGHGFAFLRDDPSKLKMDEIDAVIADLVIMRAQLRELTQQTISLAVESEERAYA